MVENVGYAPTRSILQGLAGTMPVFPIGTLAPTFTEIFGVRSVVLRFKLRGHKVESRHRIALCRLPFCRRSRSLARSRDMVRSLRVALSGSVAQPLYRRPPLYYGSTSAKNGCRGRNCTGKERLMRPFGGYLSLH